MLQRFLDQLPEAGEEGGGGDGPVVDGQVSVMVVPMGDPVAGPGGDLVRPLEYADLLADQQHVLIPLQFSAQHVVQARLPHHRRPWFRGLFSGSPDVATIASAPVVYQVHAASAWLIWAVWPFSRLVHA